MLYRSPRNTTYIRVIYNKNLLLELHSFFTSYSCITLQPLHLFFALLSQKHHLERERERVMGWQVFLLLFVCCVPIVIISAEDPKCWTFDADPSKFTTDSWWAMISLRSTVDEMFMYTSASLDGQVCYY